MLVFSSIGFAIAKRLATDGCRVMISSRKKENVERALQDLRSSGLENVDGIPCHVGKSEDRDRLIERTKEVMGGIDILVSNAAVNPTFGSILDVRR